VVEEQVKVKGFICDLKRHLSAYECKPAAKLEQQIAEMDKESTLDLPFMSFAGDG